MICYILVLMMVVRGTDISLEIQNTKKLITLYQQKLQILERMQTQSEEKRYFSQSPYIKLNGTYSLSSTFVSPHFVVSEGQVYDLDSVEPLMKVLGEVLCTDNFQITSLIHSKINILNFQSQKEEQLLKITTKNRKSYWHKRLQTNDELVQLEDKTLYFQNQKHKRYLEMKSAIIAIYSINQYKILYVAEHCYGMINVGSLQILSENQLSSRAISSFKNGNMLFILLDNKILLKIIQEIIVSEQRITTFQLQRPQITYFQPYMFVHSSQSPCYVQFQYDNNLRYPKKVCLEEQTNTTYKFKFYKNQGNIKFLYSNGEITQHYMIVVPVEEDENSFNFPYQIVAIAIIIGLIVYRKRQKKKEIRRERKEQIITEIQNYLKKKPKKSKKQ